MKVSVFPLFDIADLIASIFGNANIAMMALSRHHDPTTIKGNINPPAWYKADPITGPISKFCLRSRIVKQRNF